MARINLFIIGVILLAVSLSCKSFMPAKSTDASSAPEIDLVTPGKGLDVNVQLEKEQTASGKVTKGGGSISLTAADGSKFTLDVPANALDAETTITMTAVKNLDGAPLDNNAPIAVQLEPSGLFFKEMATLTIMPAKEIPIKEQVIFGYEGKGEDYHLAQVDPKSREIKIKLMRFSGAGVGSGSDAAWAANLMIQARTAADRIGNKIAELTQETRRTIFLEGEEAVDTAAFHARLKSLLDQLEDQVVRKEEIAAELDCKHAQRAIENLISVERQRQLLGYPSTANFEERVAKLKKIGESCRKSYRVNGSSGGATFKGEICSLDKAFVLTVNSKTGSWPLNFTPSSESGGQMEGHFASQGCTVTGSGPYTITRGSDGSGTIEWSYNTTSSCPAGSMTRTVSSKLPLQPAPDLSCP